MAVKLADPVAESREMQRQHRQAERLITLAGIGKTEMDQLSSLDAEVFTVILVILADQSGIKRLIYRGQAYAS